MSRGNIWGLNGLKVLVPSLLGAPWTPKPVLLFQVENGELRSAQNEKESVNRGKKGFPASGEPDQEVLPDCLCPYLARSGPPPGRGGGASRAGLGGPSQRMDTESAVPVNVRWTWSLEPFTSSQHSPQGAKQPFRWSPPVQSLSPTSLGPLDTTATHSGPSLNSWKSRPGPRQGSHGPQRWLKSDWDNQGMTVAGRGAHRSGKASTGQAGSHRAGAAGPPATQSPALLGVRVGLGSHDPLSFTVCSDCCTSAGAPKASCCDKFLHLRQDFLKCSQKWPLNLPALSDLQHFTISSFIFLKWEPVS